MILAVGADDCTVERSEVRDDYHRDGFATLVGLLDGGTTRAALDHLACCRAALGLPPDAGLVPVPLSDRHAQALACDERLVSVASALLEAPAVGFGFTYVCKPARTGLPARWHQDGAPWAERLGGAPALTMWVALDEVDHGNGCLRMIAGSHRLDLQPLRPEGEGRSPSLFGVEIDPALVDDAGAVDVPLRSGDGSVHHRNLIHGSGPNRSGRPRRAVAIRYRGRPVTT